MLISVYNTINNIKITLLDAQKRRFKTRYPLINRCINMDVKNGLKLA